MIEVIAKEAFVTDLILCGLTVVQMVMCRERKTRKRERFDVRRGRET